MENLGGHAHFFDATHTIQIILVGWKTAPHYVFTDRSVSFILQIANFKSLLPYSFSCMCGLVLHTRKSSYTIIANMVNYCMDLSLPPPLPRSLTLWLQNQCQGWPCTLVQTSSHSSVWWYSSTGQEKTASFTSYTVVSRRVWLSETFTKLTFPHSAAPMLIILMRRVLHSPSVSGIVAQSKIGPTRDCQALALVICLLESKNFHSNVV